MDKNKSIVPKEYTAYQLAKREGKSLKDFFGMYLVIGGSICGLILLGSSVDTLMHDPVIGLVLTGLFIYGFLLLFREFDRKYK